MDLLPNTNYKITVAAFNVNGPGPKSEPIMLKTNVAGNVACLIIEIQKEKELQHYLDLGKFTSSLFCCNPDTANTYTIGFQSNIKKCSILVNNLHI